MSLLSGIVGAASGFMTGGPVGALAGGIGGLTTGSGTTGSVLAGTQSGDASTAAFETFENNLQQQQLAMKAQNDFRGAMFNEALDNRSETLRQTNELRDLSMEQRKADDKITQEFIKSIA